MNIPNAPSYSFTLLQTFLEPFKQAALAAVLLFAGTSLSASAYVELAAFSGTTDLASRSVTLNWTTATEIHNAHFTIYRSKDQISWVQLHVITAEGQSNDVVDYRFTDNSALLGSVYYKLEWRSSHGTVNSSTIQVTMGKGGKELDPNGYQTRSSTANVSLGNFTAKFDRTAGSVRLEWSTLMENENERFIVYRSADQLVWEEVGRKVGSMHSTEELNYQIIDTDPLDLLSYYKLEWAEAGSPVYALTSINVLIGTTNDDDAGATRSSSMIDLQLVPGKKNGEVTIAWQTNETLEDVRFAIYRSTDQFNWQLVANIDGDRRPVSQNAFSFVDRNVPSGTMHYKLEWYDAYGNTSWSTASAKIESGMTVYRSYPNPTTDRVRLSSDQGEMSPTNKVKVISSDGHRYKVDAKTVDGDLDVNLSELPDGIYIIELEDGFARVHKH